MSEGRRPSVLMSDGPLGPERADKGNTVRREGGESTDAALPHLYSIPSKPLKRKLCLR